MAKFHADLKVARKDLTKFSAQSSAIMVAAAKKAQGIKQRKSAIPLFGSAFGVNELQKVATKAGKEAAKIAQNAVKAAEIQAKAIAKIEKLRIKSAISSAKLAAQKIARVEAARIKTIRGNVAAVGTAMQAAKGTVSGLTKAFGSLAIGGSVLAKTLTGVGVAVGVARIGFSLATRTLGGFVGAIAATIRNAAKLAFVIGKTVVTAVGMAIKGVSQLALFVPRALLSIRKSVEALSRSMMAMGRRLLLIGGMASAPFLAAGKAAMSFQDQMAKVATMLDVSTMDMLPNMTKQVKALSMEIGRSTEDISDGLFAILSAQVPANKAMEFMGVAAKAAIGGITDTNTAVLALTKVMLNYGEEVRDVADASDLMFAVFRQGQGVFADFANAIPMFAGQAKIAGLSIEEMGASIALTSKVLKSAQRASFAMSAMMSVFSKASDQGKEAAKKYGFELSAVTLRTIGLKGVLEKLLRGNATAEDLGKMFPRRAIRGVAALLLNYNEYLKDLRRMYNRAGLAAAAYAKRAATVAFQWERAKKLVTALAIEVGFVLLPQFEKLIALMISSYQVASDWIAEHTTLIRTAAKVAFGVAAMGAAILIAGAALSAVSAAVVVAPFAAIATLVLFVLESLGEIDVGFSKLLEGIKLPTFDKDTGLGKFFETMKMGATDLRTWLEIVWVKIQDAWGKVSVFVVNKWEWAINKITTALGIWLLEFKIIITKAQLAFSGFVDFMDDRVQGLLDKAETLRLRMRSDKAWAAMDFKGEEAINAEIKRIKDVQKEREKGQKAARKDRDNARRANLAILKDQIKFAKGLGKTWGEMLVAFKRDDRNKALKEEIAARHRIQRISEGTRKIERLRLAIQEKLTALIEKTKASPLVVAAAKALGPGIAKAGKKIEKDERLRIREENIKALIKDSHLLKERTRLEKQLTAAKKAGIVIPPQEQLRVQKRITEITQELRPKVTKKEDTAEQRTHDRNVKIQIKNSQLLKDRIAAEEQLAMAKKATRAAVPESGVDFKEKINRLLQEEFTWETRLAEIDAQRGERASTNVAAERDARGRRRVSEVRKEMEEEQKAKDKEKGKPKGIITTLIDGAKSFLKGIMEGMPAAQEKVEGMLDGIAGGDGGLAATTGSMFLTPALAQQMGGMGTTAPFEVRMTKAEEIATKNMDANIKTSENTENLGLG